MQKNAKKSSGILNKCIEFIYFFFLLLTFSSSIFILVINIKEIYDRSLGIESTLSDMSWLTDKQAIFLSLGWALLLLFMLIALFNKTIYEKRKTSIIICFSLWAIIVVEIYIESLFYYPQI